MSDLIALIVGLITIAAAALAVFKWVRPRILARLHEQRSIRDVLLGREAVSANPITGAEAVEAVPPIGQLVAEIADVLKDVVPLIYSIDHELHENSGKSLKDVVNRIETWTVKTDVRLADGTDNMNEIRDHVGLPQRPDGTGDN